MKHELSIREKHYEEIRLGFKRALFRADAGDVESGDELRLVEYFEESGTYTGRWLQVRVTHVEVVINGRHDYNFSSKQVLSIELVDSGMGQSYVLTVEGTKREVAAA